MRAVSMPSKPGVYPGVPAEEYHAWDAFSITLGLTMLESPGHFLHRKLNPIDPTPAMRLGTLVHEYLLEKESFWERYEVVPSHIPSDRRKAERRAWEVEKAVTPERVIESSQMRVIDGIYQSVMRKQCASGLLLGDGEVELSLLWEEDGVRCKGRLDKYHTEMKVLVDIKTTQDASPKEFAKVAVSRGYHIQQAHYIRGAFALGLEIEDAVLVACETSDPYGSMVYQLPEQLLLTGDNQRRRLIELYKKETIKNRWEVYPDEVIKLEYSDWALNAIDSTLDFYLNEE